MALFHFTVDQTKRSEGQSAIASAAYRSGEKLYSEYYGEYSDYTRKGGVICSEILLPPHAPPEYADRQTLWNVVEKAEHGKNAQLAYSFEISLQNEFSLEENIALARKFLLEHFVSRGMTVDVSFHEKEHGDGGSGVTTINSVVDEVFDDISTNITPKQMLSLASHALSYKMVDNSGFPFELKTKNMGKRGDCVIPLDLETNVIELHEYLFGSDTYTPTDSVKEKSKQIINDTGYTKETEAVKIQ